MPFTPDELEAMRLADEEIDRDCAYHGLTREAYNLRQKGYRDAHPDRRALYSARQKERAVFNVAVYKYRKRLRMTRREFGAKFGVTEQTAKNWELGMTRTPDRVKMAACAGTQTTG